MLVSRRRHDAAAAICVGGGTLLIAAGLKPVPSVIGYLGWMGYVWGLLMVVSSAAAATGALLRTRDHTAHRRLFWSVSLERSAWLVVAGCALVFCIGVVYNFGPVNAALTLGWTGFVIFTCTGNWKMIRQAGKGAS